jgi:hypothetical protein
VNPKQWLLTLACILFAALANAQSPKDLEAARQAMLQPHRDKPWSSYSLMAKSPEEKLAALVFRGYKSFVASQDGRKCIYTTTCSEYAMGSVRRHGILVGTLIGLERYCRCTGLDKKYYPHADDGIHLIDPVQE